MKKIVLYRALSMLALIGCVIFIFHNSLQPGFVSEVRSENTTGFLREILGFFMSRFLQDDHYVRKLAHVIEFAMLGTVAMINIKVYELAKKLRYWIGLPFGILVASIDEIIQLFVPGRSGMITDVIIDYSGYILGFFICLMLLLWYNKSQCAKKHSRRNGND